MTNDNDDEGNVSAPNDGTSTRTSTSTRSTTRSMNMNKSMNTNMNTSMNTIMNTTSNSNNTSTKKFELRNRRNLFLTGHPSVGKTTIIINTIKRLQKEWSVNNGSSGSNGSNDSKSNNNNNQNHQLHIHGFYTEECRNSKGNRIGFDIVYWNWESNNNNNNTNKNKNSNNNNSNILKEEEVKEIKRVSLSRSVDKVKKSDPHVGKYLVDIENIVQFAIPSIELTSTDSNSYCNANRNGNGNDKTLELIIIDEIGKMEMLCPEFLPAVHKALDSTRSTCTCTINNNGNGNDNGDHNDGMNRMIFGTIPTPRYGRVIPAIEEIRSRDDVTVVHVTKDNRNELGGIIFHGIYNFKNENSSSPNSSNSNSSSSGSSNTSTTNDNHIDGADNNIGDNSPSCFIAEMNQSLTPYIYTRPIGASSMNGKGTKLSVPALASVSATASVSKNIQGQGQNMNMNTNTNTNEETIIKPCGPLTYLDINVCTDIDKETNIDIDANIGTDTNSNKKQPKILFLGETASPQQQPRTKSYLDYYERSMWNIFGVIFGIHYNIPPTKKSTGTTTNTKIKTQTQTTMTNEQQQQQHHHEEEYKKLRNAVLTNGICIWDVLSNVHIQKSRKRQKNNNTKTPNDIKSFLIKYPTIEAICFIGKKAHTTFLNKLCHNGNNKNNDETGLYSMLQKRNVELIILPSSSTANSRMTKVEKANTWKDALSKFIKL